MASTKNGGNPAKEEAPKRPVVSFGPYACDRNTSVECAVWANEIEVDDDKIVTAYNVTIKRSYRDDKGEWHSNLNFRPHDLPVLEHAIRQAHAWILEARNRGNPL